MEDPLLLAGGNVEASHIAGRHLRRKGNVITFEPMTMTLRQMIDAFAKRVVRALFYREKGYPLPSGCTIVAQ